jgi:hypothetical protein
MILGRIAVLAAGTDSADPNSAKSLIHYSTTSESATGVTVRTRTRMWGHCFTCSSSWLSGSSCKPAAHAIAQHRAPSVTTQS